MFAESEAERMRLFGLVAIVGLLMQHIDGDSGEGLIAC